MNQSDMLSGNRKDVTLLGKRRKNQILAKKISNLKTLFDSTNNQKCLNISAPKNSDTAQSFNSNLNNQVPSTSVGLEEGASFFVAGNVDINVNDSDSNTRISLDVGDHLDYNQILANNVTNNNYPPITVSSHLNIDPDVNSPQDQLKGWIVKHHISQNACNELLQILKSHGNFDVPLDVRTLMKVGQNENTPQVIYRRLSENSDLAHFGFSYALKNSIKKYFLVLPDNVKINLNIDGLPLSKSSGSQFWPILGALVEPFYTEPFIITLYHGNSKPSNANDFLELFVEEALDILHNGILLEGHIISVKINSIVCDAPAKSFISFIKNHTGYFGCSKCIDEGDFLRNRMTFQSVDSKLRNDYSFKSRKQPEHHTGDSILEKLDIGMVSQISLDYMHLVCLGVMKRLLQFWVKGYKNTRCSDANLVEIDRRLNLCRKSIPNEFARKPRSVLDVDRWKATEFRQLLLYTGPVVLKNCISSDFYKHFLSLSIAIRILVDEKFCTDCELNIFSHSLLKWFIKNYANLYGEEFISYNVHNLCHLPNEVKTHNQNLDGFSSFKFENYMQKLKKKIKPNGKPLQQAVNRIKEENALFNTTVTAREYPILHYNSSKTILKSIEFQSFSISPNGIDSCCLLSDNKIVKLNEILLENETIYLKINHFLNTESLFKEPIDSKILGIQVTSSTATSNEYKIPISLVQTKCLQFPQSCTDISEKFIIFPLLHYNN